ncbi:hypothetical protein SKAU_G00284770 [Synaphobranchus kaupii]|uniref:Uncharacterized protein n=1 Tax=Synaphobranchus kaupii TaxID=118154 RepID=A0A9Q1EXU1_SYNKA|nr:hypothetical protein SKAU_G00284770 [Synaphobranchus kaupii]
MRPTVLVLTARPPLDRFGTSAERFDVSQPESKSLKRDDEDQTSGSAAATESSENTLDAAPLWMTGAKPPHFLSPILHSPSPRRQTLNPYRQRLDTKLY